MPFGVCTILEKMLPIQKHEEKHMATGETILWTQQQYIARN